MKKFITLFILCLAFVSTAWAQSIFSNPITGTNPNTSDPYTTGQTVTPACCLTATGIGRGTGITGANANDRYNANSWNTATLDPTAYFTFTLTPNVGQEIDFVSFVYTGQASNAAINSFAFRSSVDGFTADLGAPTATGATIGLSGAAFQNITTSIEFRLYAWGSTAVAGNTFSVNEFTFNGLLPLPIELIGFTAKAVNAKSTLSFSTATETNNAFFSIERSQDGARFEAIGKVTGAGTSTVKQEYTFTDERPMTGVNLYRLKQVDFDGKFSYSPVVSVNIGKVGGVRLSPQPVLDRLNVALEQPAVEAATWQVYDFAGRLLQSGTLQSESTNFEISTTTLAEGTYVLRLVNGQQIITQQFQKN